MNELLRVGLRLLMYSNLSKIVNKTNKVIR